MNLTTQDTNTLISSTPYDDVFRTLLIDCRQLIIPLINETFGEHYTGNEAVEFRQNEHFGRNSDGSTEKIITDSNFTIVGATRKHYLYECQSTQDNTLIVRIFEYAVQSGVENSGVSEGKLKVTIPQCAVLYLRSTKNTPDKMEIEIETPGGAVSFDVPITKVQKYSLDDIFEKKLFFLIPFYIFNFENRFREYNENEEKLTELKNEYIRLSERLNALIQNGEIDTRTGKALVETSNKVVENLARNYENIKEEVHSVMGGQYIELESTKIFKEGMAQGLSQGMAQGMAQGLSQGMAQGMAQGIDLLFDIIQKLRDGVTEGELLAQGYSAEAVAKGKLLL